MHSHSGAFCGQDPAAIPAGQSVGGEAAQDPAHTHGEGTHQAHALGHDAKQRVPRTSCSWEPSSNDYKHVPTTHGDTFEALRAGCRSPQTVW